MKGRIKDIEKSGHRLVTRRDFLAHGLISFAAMTTLPRFSFAACGGVEASSTYVPFMVFDMAGGAALPGNFLVGKEGGPEDLLTSYDVIGWNPREAGALNKDFGLPMSAKYSRLLAGILANTSPEARANTQMGSICHFAQDDTSSNRMNAAGLILSAGFRGSYISNGLGINDSASGGNSSPVLPSAALRPTFVRSVTDVLGAANFGGSAFRDMTVEQMKGVAEGGISLSRIQRELFGGPEGQVLGELSKCAYEKNLEFLQGVSGLDPRLDATAQGVYQINQNSDPGSESAVAAALVMNALKGQAGPGVWTLGGCDYHSGKIEPGDTKDLEMGVQIGRAIELAHRLKKPFFFQLLTDGGCNATRGERAWSGDDGTKCMTVLGSYDPNAKPKMIRQQVGHFTDGQGAERATLIGSEPSLVGYAVLANYLNVCGKISDFNVIAPGVFTGPGQLKKVLLFEGKTS
jgi:hypothetical protein